MRSRTGIEGFDELIEGGLIQGRQYLVSGSPGSGKTTFGAQFLSHGALAGEAGAYVGLSENISTIVEDMSKFNLQIDTLIKKNKLFFVDIGPNKNYGDFDELSTIITSDYEQRVTENPDVAAPSAFNVFKKMDELVKKYDLKRLVVDSLSGIRFTTSHPSLEEKSVSRFIRNLKYLGCTTLVLSELTKPDSYSIEHYASHGVIFLHNYMDKGIMVRAIQIIKMRGTKHDCEMREIEFTNKGLRVMKPIRKY